jgi:GntR family transcriptional regulator
LTRPANVIHHSANHVVEGWIVIEFHLEPASGVPTYVQLVHQVRQALQLGLLEPGDRLPTAVQVVTSLAINPNTVLKAYRDLEREGLVRARPGLGTFVVGQLPRTDPAAQAKFRKSMAAWLRSARDAGLSATEIDAIYQTAYRDSFGQEGVA